MIDETKVSRLRFSLLRDVSYKSTSAGGIQGLDRSKSIGALHEGQRRDVTVSVCRKVYELHTSLEMTFPDAARAVLRDTGDEYLRLRLRKSKAIRLNRRERRYGAERAYRFSDTLSLSYLPKYADYTAPVTFFASHRVVTAALSIRYRAKTKDGKFIISLALQEIRVIYGEAI